MKIPATFLGLLGLLLLVAQLHATPLTGDSLDIGSGNSFYTPAAMGAFGSNNASLSYGGYTVFIGQSNIVTNPSYSLIVGQYNEGGSITSSLYGGSYNDIDNSYNSLISGELNTGSLYSGAIIGFNNSITGNCQFALGFGLVSGNVYSPSNWQHGVYSGGGSIFLGRYNKFDSSLLLTVGNGANANQRANALEVYLDGKIKAYNAMEIFAPGYDAANVNSGKIVIQPSTSGSKITVDGREVVTLTDGWNGIDVGAGEFGSSGSTSGFLINGGFISGDSVAGVNTADGSASFAGGNVTIDASGYVTGNGFNSSATSWLDDIGGLTLRSETTNTVSVDFAGRNLFDVANSEEVMSWGHGNGSVTFTGNVGIGTSSPQAKVHIYNPATASATGNEVLRIGTLYSGSIVGSGGFINFTDAGNTTLGQIRSTLEANGQVAMSFSTYNSGLSERLRISNSGNVGIGTTSPQAKLDVNGDVKIAGDVKMTKRQGDISMGEFGTPGSGD